MDSRNADDDNNVIRIASNVTISASMLRSRTVRFIGFPSRAELDARIDFYKKEQSLRSKDQDRRNEFDLKEQTEQQRHDRKMLNANENFLNQEIQQRREFKKYRQELRDLFEMQEREACDAFDLKEQEAMQNSHSKTPGDLAHFLKELRHARVGFERQLKKTRADFNDEEEMLTTGFEMKQDEAKKAFDLAQWQEDKIFNRAKDLFRHDEECIRDHEDSQIDQFAQQEYDRRAEIMVKTTDLGIEPVIYHSSKRKLDFMSPAACSNVVNRALLLTNQVCNINPHNQSSGRMNNLPNIFANNSRSNAEFNETKVEARSASVMDILKDRSNVKDGRITSYFSSHKNRVNDSSILANQKAVKPVDPAQLEKDSKTNYERKPALITDFFQIKRRKHNENNSSQPGQEGSFKKSI